VGIDRIKLGNFISRYNSIMRDRSPKII